MSRAISSLVLLTSLCAGSALAAEAPTYDRTGASALSAPGGTEAFLEFDDADIDLDDPNLLFQRPEHYEAPEPDPADLAAMGIVYLDGPDLSPGRHQRSGWGMAGALAGSAAGTLVGGLASAALVDTGVGIALLPALTITGAAAGSYLADPHGFGWNMLGASAGLLVGMPVMYLGTVALIAGSFGGSPGLGIAGAAVALASWVVAPAIGAWAVSKVHSRRMMIAPAALSAGEGVVPGATLSMAL